jgi:hypothetical protein
MVGAGVLGALALVGGVTFAIASKRVPEHRDEPQAAASHPVALPSVSQALVTVPPMPGETSSLAPFAPAPPTATTPAVATLTTPAMTPRPWKTPKTAQAALATVATPGAATAAPAPSCTVATDYDSEGQPHFKKVCK